MSAKRFVLELLDAAGQPAVKVPVKVGTCGDLVTSPLGTALFLVEDANVDIWVSGAKVHSVSLADLPAKLTLKQDGGGWKA